MSLLLLASAGTAAASGSSEVHADGPSVRVATASPSIQFRDEADERPWHDDWRRENQPLVDAAVATIGVLVPGSGLAVIPFEARVSRALGVEPRLGVVATLTGRRAARVEAWGLTPGARVQVDADVQIPHASVACRAWFSREVTADPDGTFEIVLRGRQGCAFTGPDPWVVTVTDGERTAESRPFVAAATPGG